MADKGKHSGQISLFPFWNLTDMDDKRNWTYLVLWRLFQSLYLSYNLM